MTTDKADELTFSIKISREASNYKMGIAAQSVLIGVFCILGLIQEILALTSHTLLPFMQKEMGRAITHVLVASLSLGFLGGIGIYISIIEIFFALVCYLTATAEAWNPIEIDSGSGYEPSTT